MIPSFDVLEKRLTLPKPLDLFIAGAADIDTLLAVKIAQDRGYVYPILVGESESITPLIKKAKLKKYDIVEPSEGRNLAQEAVHLTQQSKAGMLMKGTVNTTVYMRAALDRDTGLRGDGLASLIAVFEIPGYHKLLFVTDSGLNVAPNLKQKKIMLRDSLEVLKTFGYTNPKVAFLAASEVVNPNIPATTDAQALTGMVERGEVGPCIAEGPIAFDVLFAPAAAKHKGIESLVSGDVDLIIFPNIETGNAVSKCWIHFCKAKWGGMVLGCAHPIILGSRSDTANVKIYSILLGCLSAQSRQ